MISRASSFVGIVIGAVASLLVLASRAEAQEPAEAGAGATPAAPTSPADAGAPPPAIADATSPAAPNVQAAGSDVAAGSERPRDEGAPEGRAAPPTESATRGGGHVRAGLEVFAQYGIRNTVGPGDNRTWFHQFDVPRVHGAVEGEWEGARGRVVVEATRSAAEGSLIGVAGDSLVLRVREAYASYRPWGAFTISAGVIPTLTVPELDGTWMLRAIAPSAVESAGLLSAADIGGKMRFDFPQRYGFIAVAGYNGEGYTSRELNRGKNVETALEVHPLPNGPLLPLGVFVSHVVGSSGTIAVRADRLTSGLVWQGARVRAGAFFTYAWGRELFGTQHGLVASGFLRVEPINRVLLGARADHVVRDTAGDPSDALTTAHFTGGYRLADPLETFLAFTRAIPTTRAQSELPGSNHWEARAVARVVF